MTSANDITNPDGWFPGCERELDPQIREALASRYNPELPPLTSLTPQEIRAAMPDALPAVMVPIGSSRDLTTPGPAGSIPMRIYLPEVLNSREAIVFFHGGGFVFGSINTHENIARLLCRSTGRPVISS